MAKIRGNRARLLIAALIGCLVPLVGLGSVGAAPVTATAIRVDSVQTPGVTVPPTADAPAIWVAADTPFTVTATAIDSTGAPAPFSFTKDTTVLVSAVTPAGTVNLGSVVVPQEQATFSFSRTLSQDIDDAFIHLQTVEAKKSDPVRQGDSGTFDVQREFKQSDAATTPDVSIGGTEQGAECIPSVQEKICFEVHLPQGTATGNHLLSIGNCDQVNPCRQGSDYWWSLVEVTATRDNPAYTDMGLDKSLKGVAFENGVPKVKFMVRESGAIIWVEAPPCPSKGVIGADQEFCHDVTEGHRDNSGDTWIRLLWLRDIRGSIK